MTYKIIIKVESSPIGIIASKLIQIFEIRKNAVTLHRQKIKLIKQQIRP